MKGKQIEIMELEKILQKLEHFNPQVVNKVAEITYIQTHKMVMPNQTSYFPECLYVGYVSDLPAVINPDQVSNLICIQNTPLPERYRTCPNLNLILMEYGTNQFDVLNQIADIMIDEAKLISDMKRLLDALYSNLGLQHMVDVAFEAFGNPIFVNDTAYKILAMSQKASYNDPTLEAEKDLGYIHELNVSALKRDKILERSSNSDYPIYSQKDHNSAGWLFRSIKIHNILVGEVALVENNRPFRNIDFELLDRFSKLIAIEMEKNDFYKDNEGVMFNYFLADLLSEKYHNLKAITQRLDYLNWKVYPYFRILVILDIEMGLSNTKVQRIGKQVHQILSDSHWTVNENKLVVFISRPNQDCLTSNELSSLYEFFRQNHLSAGISNPYSDILDTQKYYNQALIAGQLGISIHKEPGIYAYADYIFAHMGHLISKQCDILDFFHPAIFTIQQYDLDYHTDLLNTLKCYLKFVNDPVSAAKMLNIHRNTLQYRVNKIKEIAQIDLDNGDERLHIQLSLKFMEFQKSLYQYR